MAHKNPASGQATSGHDLQQAEGTAYMCGIVGYIGPRDATPIIVNGLKRLEYRGYDSAGIAVLENSHIEVRRDAGKLDKLVSLDRKSTRLNSSHSSVSRMPSSA